jgi:hypothetical protein
MEASIRCLQGLSCVLCSEPHDSRQLQLILSFYSSCKYYPKSRSLISILSSFQALQQQLHMSLNRYVSSLQLFQPCFQPISLFPSSAPIETLYFSQLISPTFRLSNRKITSLNWSLSSIQVLQTFGLSDYLSPPFRCSNWNYMSIHSSFSFIPSGDPYTKIFILTSKYTWHTCSRCYVSVLHLITIITSICLNCGNKACILESKKSMSNVCSQELTAWSNVGIFYKSLASQLLLKGPKNFELRHPRCVNQITNMVYVQSKHSYFYYYLTVVHLAVNNYVFRPLRVYRPSSGYFR